MGRLNRGIHPYAYKNMHGFKISVKKISSLVPGILTILNCLKNKVLVTLPKQPESCNEVKQMGMPQGNSFHAVLNQETFKVTSFIVVRYFISASARLTEDLGAAPWLTKRNSTRTEWSSVIPKIQQQN